MGRSGSRANPPVVDPRRIALARDLTSAVPSWGIWKNVASALSGTGDIDSVALEADMGTIEREFVSWAATNGLTPVFRCEHAADLMNVLVAVDRDAGVLVELDVTRRKTYRGSTLFVAMDVVPLLVVDSNAVRRIRPGAEGVLLLFHNGVRRGGRPDPEGLARRRIPELLAEDPNGVELGALMFGAAPGAAARAARAVAAGRWDRPAVAAVELAFLVRALIEPRAVARRVWFRAVTKRRCPVIHVAYAPGRRLPDDTDGWLAEVAAGHDRLDVVTGPS